ncbi:MULTISPECIES: type I polyketide synthase [unclassified Streptomyces]|uniref:type I polyketide synthase n=1 Tax=unclassified Streptomyces TaxID=2593676 RepID=UPI0014893715|nr:MULTISPECIES: type I polyketide synthase [unclassified Streptomyces]
MRGTSGTHTDRDAATAADDTGITKALAAIRQLRGKVDALERTKREGIAVVGMGCRLPGGVTSPDAFWRVVSEGVDTIGGVPADRWELRRAGGPDGPDGPSDGALPSHGGFIDGVDRFDPYFFGISPREAARMDPQQRHFLEVAWEALEDAGLTREKLQGSPTGVFVGANASDYLQLQLEDPAAIDTYTVVGGTNCIIANRLSYVLDLRGPSLTVDTACSSSLVAVHLAAQSLRSGDCDAAVAGGLNLILSPSLAEAHAKGLPLAPDGRCKTFDAEANGYARGEGIGVLVLKRLSDAVADGDRIWAVVRGSAVNQDGLTNGLTAPNGLSQQAVIRQALRNAHVEPSQVTLLEAHGTGTALGDPIEVEALNAVYGEPAAEGDVCALGSVKTNIGHLEAGAGMAGLIRAALSIHHRAIAPHLHLTTLNPHIDLDGSRLVVPTSLRPWDVPDERRHAAVSSFGAGGTNAHVILGPAPADAERADERPPAGEGPWLLPLSAAAGDALAPLARAYRDHLRSAEGLAQRFDDIVHTATARRTRHEHRLTVVAGSHDEAAGRLTRWLDGEEAPGVVTGRANGSVADGVVFVFPGQGSQRPGMGRELLDACPEFRGAVGECDDAMRPYLDGRSIVDEVMRLDADAALDRIDLIQPALFALAVGLAARCRSFGVEPDVVVGHSMGEVAAAHIAGALGLDDAARVICRRSALLRRISCQGAMLVVALPLDQAEQLVEDCRDKASVAVSNSPTSTVLSGDPRTLVELAETLRARNVFCRPVKVDVASHSPQVDPLREELLADLAGLSPRPSRIPVLSTVTGELTDGSDFDAAYWMRNLREPVLFWDAVQSLIARDNGVFVEMSPHPVLLSAVEQGFEFTERDGLALPAMRREEPETHGTLEILGALHAHGMPAAAPATLLPADGRLVRLPAYTWQHERFWFRDARTARPVTVTAGSRAPEPTPAPAPELPASSAVSPRTELYDRLASAAVTERREVLRETVLRAVADVLEMPPERIDPDAGFFQMGMDSMLAARVRVQLEAGLGRKLPAPVMFEHPSVEALSAHLLDLAERLMDRRPGGPAPQPPGAPAGEDTGTPTTLPARPDAPAQAPADDVSDDLTDDLTEEELLALLAEEVRASTRTAGGSR